MRLAAVLIVVLTTAAQAQQATLRGAVVSETGDRIPYAVVIVEPGFGERFASENGTFALTSVTPGRYRLSVRQVGYSPFDSTIDVTAATPEIRVQLKHIAVRIAELNFSAHASCRVATTPDSGSTLGIVYAQLRENADQYRLLTQRYPFTADMQRQFKVLRRGFPDRVQVDTTHLGSWLTWQYAPGALLIPDPGGSTDRVLQMVTLTHLADSAFWGVHCFSSRGLDTALGRTWIRVDFTTVPSVKTPDVNGSAFLDPDSYKLGVIRFVLTHIEKATHGLESWTATTEFEEIRPNVPYVKRVRVVSMVQHDPGPGAITEIDELQDLLRVQFVRSSLIGGSARDSTP